MARITVEDCLDHVANRFELVMLAAKRARQIMRGSADPTVPWENDKATVVALREIASGHTDFSDAHEIDLMPSIQTTESSESESIEMIETMEESTESAESSEESIESDEEEHHEPDSEASSEDHSTESE